MRDSHTLTNKCQNICVQRNWTWTNVCPNIFIENWYKQISELYLWKIYLNILTYSSISDLHPHLLYNFWKAQGMTFEMALPWISHTIWNFIKTRVFSFCCRELSAGRSGLLLVKSVRVKSLIFYIFWQLSLSSKFTADLCPHSSVVPFETPNCPHHYSVIHVSFTSQWICTLVNNARRTSKQKDIWRNTNLFTIW